MLGKDLAGLRRTLSSGRAVRWFSAKMNIATSAAASDSPLLRWALDYPSEEEAPRMSPAGLVVQGWVLLANQGRQDTESARVVAEWGRDYESSHPLDVRRPDVIRKVLQAEPETHPQLHCGFRFTLPKHLKHFRLWLQVGESRYLLKDIKIDDQVEGLEQGVKVLYGKQGWLFLDNDTNQSVDQHRGRLRLTAQGLADWEAYIQALRRLAGQPSLPWALLVAPTKESVLAHYHPQPRESGGPMDQLTSLVGAGGIVHPVPALQALGDAAFYPTDTHWTHRGAMVATVELGVALGLSRGQMEECYARDKYRTREMTGDLGNKFSPTLSCQAELLVSYQHGRHKIYDNGLPNFGRVVVIHDPAALVGGTLLVFGSSSSYSMFNYLARLFSRVVFVHSAGNIDPDFVAAVTPDYLVAQTNARFVVQVPVANYRLSPVIQEKVTTLSQYDREMVQKRQVPASRKTLERLGLWKWHQDLPPELRTPAENEQ